MSVSMRTPRSAAGMLLIGAAMSASALAGTSSSGGGMILKDSFNPWFLENTEDVRYCVRQDHAVFTPTGAIVEKQINAALAYWSRELQKATYEHYSADLAPPNDQFRLGTQRFIAVPCAKQVDLVFQLGSADDEQAKLMPDIAATVAATLRTSYDRRLLRGKGFIYVAPDAGYEPTRPREVRDGLWSMAGGQLLYLTLVHELGHVFGLPDSAQGESLMSYNWVAGIIDTDGLLVAPEQVVAPNVVRFSDFLINTVKSSRLSADKAKVLQRVFGIPALPHTVATFHYTGDGLQVLAGAEGQTAQPVGEAHFYQQTSVADKLLALVWLPPEQTVYALKNGSRRARSALFPALWSQMLRVTGSYKVKETGVVTPITMRMAADDLSAPQIDAYVDGKIVIDIVGQVF